MDTLGKYTSIKGGNNGSNFLSQAWSYFISKTDGTVSRSNNFPWKVALVAAEVFFYSYSYRYMCGYLTKSVKKKKSLCLWVTDAFFLGVSECSLCSVKWNHTISWQSWRVSALSSSFLNMVLNLMRVVRFNFRHLQYGSIFSFYWPCDGLQWYDSMNGKDQFLENSTCWPMRYGFFLLHYRATLWLL